MNVMSAKRKPSRSSRTSRNRTRYITEVVTLSSSVQLTKDDVQALDEGQLTFDNESFVGNLVDKYADIEDDYYECEKCKTTNDQDAKFCKECGIARTTTIVTFQVPSFHWGSFDLEETHTMENFAEVVKTVSESPGFTGEATGFVTYVINKVDDEDLSTDRHVMAFVVRPNFFEWRDLVITVDP